MTEAEIMKALECCVGDEYGYEVCHECPFCEVSNCNEGLMRAIIALINRKNAESDEKDAEIEEYKERFEMLDSNSQMAIGYADALEERARAEAIKEFAETAALYTVQYAFDFVREFIREKTKLDPVYSFNPTENELKKYFEEAKYFMGEIAKEMGVEL